MNMEKLLDKLFKKRVIINCEKDPYLHRWFMIKTPWLGVYIHKFVRSDEDRALHDHPWPFLVIPIWRGYIEYRNLHGGRLSGLTTSLKYLAESTPSSAPGCGQPRTGTGWSC
jgi:hypothetical protein